MKNRVLFTLAILCVVMAFMASSLYAQEEASTNRRIGSAAAPELLIPVGGRDVAMGGASIAISQGIESVYWNPAGLARMEHSVEALVSTMKYLADINVHYAAVGIQFGKFGTVAFSAKTLGFGDILLTTNNDPEGRSGRTYSQNYLTLGLSYARRFTDAITVGGTFKIISEKIGRVNGNAMAVDIGVQYHNAGGIQGLHFAVVLMNYGPQMKFSGSGLLRRGIAMDALRPEQFYESKPASFELPSTLQIGMSYTRDLSESLALALSGVFVNDNMALNQYRFGGEIGYKLDQLRIYGRGGYELAEGTDNVDEYIFGPCAGLGIYFKTASIDVMFDVAYRVTEYFDNNTIFSFRFGF